MKKKRMRLAVAMICCLLILTVLPVQAETNMQLADLAELLSKQEKLEMDGQLEALEERTGWDLMALTVEDADGRDATSYAEAWFDEYTVRDDGVICSIDMDNREIVVRAFGEAMDYITDARAEDILDAGYEQVANEEYCAALREMFFEVENIYMEKRDVDAEKEDVYAEEKDSYNAKEEDTNAGEKDSYKEKDANAGKKDSYMEEKPDVSRMDKRNAGAIPSYFAGKEITLSELLIALGLALIAAGLTINTIFRKYRLKSGGYRYPIETNGNISLNVKEDNLIDSFVTTRQIPKPQSSSDVSSTHNHTERNSVGGSRSFSGTGSRGSSGGSRSFSSTGTRKSSGGSRSFSSTGTRKSSGTRSSGGGSRGSSGGSRKF